MTRFARIIVKWLTTLFLVWLSFMLAAACAALVAPVVQSRNVLACLITFAASLVIFSFFKFTSLYVFGHELTHLITAKLFLKDTGKMKLSAKKGYVEVIEPNVWIALAPYIIPFYAVAAMGVYGFSQIFCFPSPWWATLAFACTAGIAYSYHCVLTTFALRRAQSDLDTYGRYFSLSIIICGNLFFILLSLLMVTRQWGEAWHFFCRLIFKQWEIIITLTGKLHS